jgi:hypothetical protein
MVIISAHQYTLVSRVFLHQQSNQNTSHKILHNLRINVFFFERRTLDECVSIDIAENTRLYPSETIIRQQKEKIKLQKQHRRVGLGHQYALNSILLNNLDRLDGGINTSRTTCLQRQLCLVGEYSTRQQQHKLELAAPTKTSTLM